MLLTILLLAIAYLLGSIPSGLWIGQIFYHKNLHNEGSGNTGTTNTFRILGPRAGIIVFIADVSKGVLATTLPLLFHLHTMDPLVFGLVAVFGHTVSIFDHFKGGKAVATSGGVILSYDPLFFLFLFLVFIVALLLFSTVSIASISVAIASLAGIVLFPIFHFILLHYDWPFSLAILFIALIILVRHRSNIQRILSHTENTVPFGLNLSHQKKP